MTDRWVQTFIANNIAGGQVITIKVSLSNGSQLHGLYMAAEEYSGVDPVHPINASAVGSGRYPQVPATANLTTTIANTTLAATAWDSNEAFNASENGPAYTTDQNAGAQSISGGCCWANLTEYKIAPTAGVWNSSTTDSSQTNDWVIQVLALAPAGLSHTTTSDGNGNYSFSNVNNGTYSVIPSSGNYTIMPTYQAVQVNGASVSGVNFTAASKTGSISGNVSPASAGSGSTLTLSGAVPTLVQSAGNAVSAGNSSITAKFPIIARAEDTVIVFLRFGGTTVSTITDTQGNAYDPVTGPMQWGTTRGGSTDRVAQVFVAKAIAGGALSVTANLAGSSTHGLYAVALEYSGVDTTNPVNAFAVGNGTVSQNGAPTTANMNTTVANTKLVATSWDSNDSYAANNNGSGFQTIVSAAVPSVAGGAGWGNLTEDATAPTTGNWNASATTGPNLVDWAIQAVALTPGAGANDDCRSWWQLQLQQRAKRKLYGHTYESGGDVQSCISASRRQRGARLGGELRSESWNYFRNGDRQPYCRPD